MSGLQAIGISGSPAPASRSRLLVAHVLSHLAALGISTEIIDLSQLPADALLARRRDDAVDGAIARAGTADILVLGTPIYRATYAGQLKAFFDLFPPAALRDRVVALIATGAGPGHLLAIEHGLRPLVASLEGLTASRALYVTDAQLPSGAAPPKEIDDQAGELATELRLLAHALTQRDAPRPIPAAPARPGA